ncbi:cytochrome P450 [Gloeopeniophorella convolvens]|nr:cytochrome P450 [Gloeopeniophorella convolvens]
MSWSIGFIEYGTKWRHLRHKFHMNFHPAAAKTYEPHEQRAAHQLLRSLLSNPDGHAQHLRHMAGQTILSIAYGIDVLPENDPYVASAEAVVKAVVLAASKEALLFDSIPWLRRIPAWLPGAGLKRKALQAYPIVAASIEIPYNEVKAALVAGSAAPSVATSMISELDEDSKPEDVWASKVVPGNMYIAGADTTLSVLQTFMLAMLRYPKVQRKAQAEIDKLVGNSRLPDFSDQDGLPYVDAVLKEALRWHPVLPLGMPIPHRTTQNDIYNGYFIPAGATVIGNTWWDFIFNPSCRVILMFLRAIFHDPEAFPEPDKFIPERWLSHDAPRFPDQAFGFGRRECPGRFMARASVWASIVGILAAFDLTPVEGDPPDEEYSSGMVSYVKPFVCHIRPRSEVAAALVEATANMPIE